MHTDGYILVRGVLDRDKVLGARRRMLQHLQTKGALQPDAELMTATIARVKSAYVCPPLPVGLLLCELLCVVVGYGLDWIELQNRSSRRIREGLDGGRREWWFGGRERGGGRRSVDHCGLARGRH